jgi:hypothetical protein
MGFLLGVVFASLASACFALGIGYLFVRDRLMK